MHYFRLVIVFVLIFQLARLSSIAAVFEQKTLAPKSTLADDSEVKPYGHSEEDEMVIAYLRAHSEGGLIAHQEIEKVKQSPEFRKWVQSHYIFTPFDGYHPYKGWEILQAEQNQQDLDLRRVISGIAVVIGLAASITIGSVYPVLISLFPSIIMLTPFLPFLSHYIHKIPTWQNNGFIRIQTEIPVASLQNLHRDKAKDRFPPLSYAHYDIHFVSINLERLQRFFRQENVIFSPKKALIIGPGNTVLEISELLKAYPDLEEIHVVLVADLNSLYETTKGFFDDKKNKTKIIFHQTSVVGLPHDFKKQFNLVLMRHLIDFRYFTESQARQAMIDVHASLSDHGILVSSEMEAYAIDNTALLAHFDLFQHLIRPMRTIPDHFMTFYVKASSGLLQLFQDSSNLIQNAA